MKGKNFNKERETIVLRSKVSSNRKFSIKTFLKIDKKFFKNIFSFSFSFVDARSKVSHFFNFRQIISNDCSRWATLGYVRLNSDSENFKNS